jgi:hypothetical protein
MLIVPEEIASNPAIMRSVVDLPHPEGADQHEELAVADHQAEAVDRARAPPSYLFAPSLRPLLPYRS